MADRKGQDVSGRQYEGETDDQKQGGVPETVPDTPPPGIGGTSGEAEGEELKEDEPA
jgi:hypothetical protein